MTNQIVADHWSHLPRVPAGAQKITFSALGQSPQGTQRDSMTKTLRATALSLGLIGLALPAPVQANDDVDSHGTIKHVLLISVDGLQQVPFQNVPPSELWSEPPKYHILSTCVRIWHSRSVTVAIPWPKSADVRHGSSARLATSPGNEVMTG
jgi:hypothetical protein